MTGYRSIFLVMSLTAALTFPRVGSLTVVLAAKPPAASPLGTVQAIQHGLSVRPPAQGFHSAKVKDPVFERYELKTGSGQRAAVRFQDGTTLHFDANTDVQLTSPSTTRVSKGTVAEFLKPGSDHRVVTAAAVAAAIGTVFLVQQAGDQSHFVVLRGALQVQNPHGFVVVKSNHQTFVSPNSAPQAPTPADAKAAFSWSDTLPTPDLGEDVSLDANGGTIQGYSSQRTDGNGQWDAERIHDGLLTTGWETADGETTNQWIKLGFAQGQFYRISDVIIDPAATGGDPAAADLKDFQIKVSSTGTADADFTTVFTGTCSQEATLQDFTLPVPVRARYIELLALDNYGDPTHLAVAEFEAVATASLFAQPWGIAVDKAGNVYVADKNANRVEKLSPRGTVLGAWGSKGSNEGQYLKPQGIAVNPAGDIFVAVTGNDRIVKLSPEGKVLAVWGDAGTDPGAFETPEGMTFANGHLYVADTVNDRIQVLNSSGAPVRVIGGITDLGTKPGQLFLPVDVGVDGKGNIYVADSENSRIQEFSAKGKFIRVIGSEGTNKGQLDQPESLVVDRRGDIFVADSLNYRIEEFTPRGKVANLWGSYGQEPGKIGIVSQVRLDPKGNLVIADPFNSRLERFSPGGTFKASIGKFATVPQELEQPEGIAVDSHGNIYVTDEVNHRVQERDPQGNVIAIYGHYGFIAAEKNPGLDQMAYPHGIAIDKNGEIYVVDTLNFRILLLSNRGPIGAIGTHGTAPGQLAYPLGDAVDSLGNIYVIDAGGSRVDKFDSTGKLITSWGSNGHGDGQFFLPEGIAVDNQGHVYVADFGNSRIEKFSDDGTLLATWGSPNFDGSGRFTLCNSVATDSVGNVYVGDYGHDEIQKLSPDGTQLQVFKMPGYLPAVSAVTVDSQGNVYATDSQNASIVKFAPNGNVLDIWS